MKQALHIFGKDVRHLWPHIAATMVLVGGHAVLDVLQTPVSTIESGRINPIASILLFLLMAAWWFLIAAAVYEETVPGDRQFWVTRPYSWKSLLGAKLLFVITFVSVPLFASDCFILALQGFAVLPYVPALLFRQLLVSCWLIVPALAVASITRGMRQFSFWFALVLIAVVTESLLARDAPIDSASARTWVFVGTMLAVAGAILWQYSKRQTIAVRAILAALGLVILPGLSALPSSGNRVGQIKKNSKYDLAGVRISFDLARVSRGYGTTQSASGRIWTTFLLPLNVSGLPPGTAFTGGGKIAIGSTNESSLPYGEIIRINDRINDKYFQRIYLNAVGVGTVKSHLVDLHGWLRFTLVSDTVTATAPFPSKNIVVPGVGLCDAYGSFQKTFTVCRAAVHPSAATVVWLEHQGLRSSPVTVSGSPSLYNVFWGLSPVEKWAIEPDLGELLPAGAPLNGAGFMIRFTAQEPLAEMIRDVSAQNINLAPYLQ